MSYQKYISRNPEVMLGKPIITGTRITVSLILDKLSNGYTIEDLLVAYPNLNKDQILATMAYASAVIANEEILEV
ncbi:MAG: DUF433 domain-containing protein [Cytophagales bacterium]|nr:DUF433 domain-containing protein [Cytophagales bacterium]